MGADQVLLFEFRARRSSSRFLVIRPKDLPKVRGQAMQENSTEYVCLVNFDSRLPDEHAWRERLLEIGLDHEAFSFSSSPTGNALIRFWELDRPEALRIIAKVGGMAV